MEKVTGSSPVGSTIRLSRSAFEAWRFFCAPTGRPEIRVWAQRPHLRRLRARNQRYHHRLAPRFQNALHAVSLEASG